VTLVVSAGPEPTPEPTPVPPVLVPDVRGFAEADASALLEEAGLELGERFTTAGVEPAGTVVSQDPAPDTEVAPGTSVSFTVSEGPAREGPPPDPAIPTAVVGELDAASTTVGAQRGLPPPAVPYVSASESTQAAAVNRWQLIHDPAAIAAEEATLKRLGLLPADAALAALLDRLYGQAQPVAYIEDQAIGVLEGVEKLSAPQRALAVREIVRAALDQAFDLSSIRVNNRSQGDRALARLSLELGDATAAMLEWASLNLSGEQLQKALDNAIPGKDGLREGMPPIIRAEYELPYTSGRVFVEALRARGGWPAVDQAWASPPQSTEQILHPERYPNDKPVGIDLSGVAGSIPGWSESWAQTMGELRLSVWLSDGAPASQAGPAEPATYPGASAASGWGGDRLVTLEGPDGSWAVVWQTAWDGDPDANEFAAAASAAVSDLPGAHGVFRGADLVGGLPSPVLVLLASDDGALGSVADALGLSIE
jgi:hypothetical protein